MVNFQHKTSSFLWIFSQGPLGEKCLEIFLASTCNRGNIIWSVHWSSWKLESCLQNEFKIFDRIDSFLSMNEVQLISNEKGDTDNQLVDIWGQVREILNLLKNTGGFQLDWHEVLWQWVWALVKMILIQKTKSGPKLWRHWSIDHSDPNSGPDRTFVQGWQRGHRLGPVPIFRLHPATAEGSTSSF